MADDTKTNQPGKPSGGRPESESHNIGAELAAQIRTTEAFGRRQQTVDERLAVALERKRKLDARIGKLQSAKTAQEKRRDARRAFIIGQAVLTHHAAKGVIDAPLPAILDEHVKKPSDREVIADLLAAA
jgi:hypothetical protein